MSALPSAVSPARGPALCVAYSCPPILDPQSILLAKMLGPLASQGYPLQVVGLDPASSGARTDPFLSGLVPDVSEITRVRSSEKQLWHRGVTRYMPSLLGVPDKHLPVHFRALRAGQAQHARRPARLIFTWAQYHSCSLVGLKLKRSLGLPWVAHFSDPWLEDPYRRRRPWQRQLNAAFEHAVMSAADALIFVSDETLELTLSNYPRSWREKAHVIPHCFDAALYPEARVGGDEMVVRHLGNLYGDRTVRYLLEAVASLRSAGKLPPSLRFEFVGRQETALAEAVRSAGLEDVVILRQGVTYLESLREMKQAAVLLLVEAPGATSLFLPSKLIDYLGAERPVLALTPLQGPAARLLTDAGDKVVAPDDPAGIAAAIREMAARMTSGTLGGFRRSKATLAQFDCRQTTARLAEVFDRVLDDGSQRGH